MKIDWKDSPIHRWYFLTEGLPIELVRKFVPKAESVLDPFVGCGTVLVEAMQQGKRSVGIDINPFMCLVSRAKTKTYDPMELRDYLEGTEAGFKQARNGILNPPSPSLRKYYLPNVLSQLALLRDLISRIRRRKIRELFQVLFARTAVETSNLRRCPAPRFHLRRVRQPIYNRFADLVRMAIEDVSNYTCDTPCHVIRGDSRDLDFIGEKFKLVLCSPPYCNNVDFVRHTQLELLWLGFAKSSKDLGKIRDRSITSCEAMAHVGKESDPKLPEAKKIANRIAKRSERAMDRVVLQYFAGMERHFEGISSVLKSKGRAIYVIGDSWIYDTYVPTHKMIGKIAKKVGFDVKIVQIRERFSARPHTHGLREYLIMCQKR